MSKLCSLSSIKRFFIDVLETKKRSEFVKKHQEIKNAVRYLPKRYQKILQDKENEFKINYLILDIQSEKYKEGLNKGVEICKDVYQKDSSSKCKEKKVHS